MLGNNDDDALGNIISGLFNDWRKTVAREREAAMRDAIYMESVERAANRFVERSAELHDACKGPDACVLLIRDNDWRSTAVDFVPMDGAPVMPASAPTAPAAVYRAAGDALGPGPHGLLRVCPGVHAVSSLVDGRTVVEMLTLYARETYALRLDREAYDYRSCDANETARMADMAAAGALTLYDYDAHVAVAHARSATSLGAAEAVRECTQKLQEALAAILRGKQREAVEATRAASVALIGVPLTSFAPITDLLGFHAFDLYEKQKPREAWALLQAGFAVLPGDSTLLAVLGELQLRAGRFDEGRANPQRALARPLGLAPDLRDRALGQLT